MNDEAARLATAMGVNPDAWYPTAYGYLKRTVQQHLDGALSLDGLDRGLSAVELALVTARARLQEQHNART